MEDSNDLKKITLISESLDQLGLLTNLVRKYNYPDELQIYQYSNSVQSIKKFSDGQEVEVTAGGFSFSSPGLALLKCLMETTERLAASCYRKKSFLVSSFNQIKRPALNPDRFKSKKGIGNKVFSWSIATDLISSKKVYVPSQCVYYSYKYLKGELILAPRTSTGAAGGFDHENTLLRGIYEIVERDAFMCIYLAQIKAPKLKIESIKNKRVALLLDKAKRYNLNLMLFDLTTDLGIPVYLGVILDKTGLGPSISLGLKSSLRKDDAILGSLEEAVYIRPWMRKEMLFNRENIFPISPKNTTSLKQRGQFWLSPNMAKHLQFLLNQKDIDFKDDTFTGSPKEELKQVTKVFNNKSLEVFYVDIEPFNLSKNGCYFYKVISPELQPMFFDERYPDIRNARLRQVAKYFHKGNFSINRTPHPFL